MNRFHEMTVFLAVAEARSFAAAARRLEMSAPTVTRSVAALEHRLGVLLLVRTTRSLRLTEAGERYAADCRRILDDVEQADDAAAGVMGAPRGALSITAPAFFGELHVMPAVLGYLRAHREVSVRTLLVDRVVNLLDEGVDVAVRIGALPDSTLTAVPVGQVRRVVCAAPAFLQKHGEPKDLDALLRFCTITAAMEGRGTQWRFQQDGQARRLSVDSQLTVTSFQAAVLAACEGWGLTQVVSYQVARHLASGALQVVLRDFELPPMPVHVVYPEGRKSSAKVRSFVDFCVDALRRDLATLPA
ncbi:LysR family transcriptional regulator [Achromobacter marplatensis]|uniref:DNA-binding transcriptional LysR family regulator n=1 Tax=Achromobacter marplatensis TaxID=470868 RepID=A0ABX9GA68_9BURK|nr:LysR family transcriptional regulator [Achromobacter marplatensis]RBP16981.1 DNA-binding transcriptional LysR family regulator [Achromobacter marplatensis]CAB3688987.1 HTH-type transcriptional regulator DmlR [Achromobacter marplatensis]